MSVCPEISKYYRCLIRTGVGTSVAHLICERTRRRAADPIGIETVIPRSGDQRAVAINIDTTRSRAAPGQVRSPSPVYQVATRAERDLARCRCRCGRWSHGRSGRWCRSRRGRRCGCRSRCRRRGRRRRRRTHRLPIMEGILLRTAADSHAPVHPCVQVIGRGAGIIIVARISRLDPRVRLQRQWSDYVREGIVRQPGPSVIGGSARPHPVTWRAGAGWLATGSCPLSLIVPDGKEATS